MSARIWQLLAPWQRRHKRALENLARAYPDKSADEHRQIAMAMWGNLGRVMAEMMQIDRLLADPSRIQIVNPKVLGRYDNKLGPIIGVSAPLRRFCAVGLIGAVGPYRPLLGGVCTH